VPDGAPRHATTVRTGAEACTLAAAHDLFGRSIQGSTAMPRAIWNGTVIAESDDTVVVERNHYFPRESVRADLLTPSDTTSFCPWKGVASYYSLQVDGKTNKDAVWYYPEPKDAAKEIRDRLAFWKGVEVVG
jgi:uncharacterized protein (DUF427 family)